MRDKLIEKIHFVAERIEEVIFLDLKSLSNDELTEIYVDFRIQEYLESLSNLPEEVQAPQSDD